MPPEEISYDDLDKDARKALLSKPGYPWRPECPRCLAPLDVIVWKAYRAGYSEGLESGQNSENGPRFSLGVLKGLQIALDMATGHLHRFTDPEHSLELWKFHKALQGQIKRLTPQPDRAGELSTSAPEKE